MVDTPDDEGKGSRRADIYEARMTGTLEELDRALRTFSLDVGCSHPHFKLVDDRHASVMVYADLAQIEELKAAGLAVALGDNVSERAEMRRGEIGTGDRFEGGRVVPRGFGTGNGEWGDGRQDPQR